MNLLIFRLYILDNVIIIMTIIIVNMRIQTSGQIIASDICSIW